MVLVLIALAFLVGSFFFFVGSVASLLSGGLERGEVAVVEVLDGIFDAKAVVEQLTDLKKDREVKAVVLRIDSPGGSVGAAQEIFESVKEVRSAKPIVASMGTVAASGGYYVAAPASRIVANPGTITGSIGVRMEHLNVEELLRWARLRPLTLKSGRFKDVGSPTRAMTTEEREYLEGILKRLHDQFKQAVAESRGLTGEEIDEIADGRVLTGLEAREKKLVDEIGNLPRAVKIAGELAGIKGEPEFFFSIPKHRKPWEYLIEGMVDRLLERVIGTSLVFLY